jgi:hypothetical protein
VGLLWSRRAVSDETADVSLGEGVVGRLTHCHSNITDATDLTVGEVASVR